MHHVWIWTYSYMAIKDPETIIQFTSIFLNRFYINWNRYYTARCLLYGLLCAQHTVLIRLNFSLLLFFVLNVQIELLIGYFLTLIRYLWRKMGDAFSNAIPTHTIHLLITLSGAHFSVRVRTSLFAITCMMQCRVWLALNDTVVVAVTVKNTQCDF